MVTLVDVRSWTFFDNGSILFSCLPLLKNYPNKCDTTAAFKITSDNNNLKCRRYKLNTELITSFKMFVCLNANESSFMDSNNIKLNGSDITNLSIRIMAHSKINKICTAEFLT